MIFFLSFFFVLFCRLFRYSSVFFFGVRHFWSALLFSGVFLLYYREWDGLGWVGRWVFWSGRVGSRSGLFRGGRLFFFFLFFFFPPSFAMTMHRISDYTEAHPHFFFFLHCFFFFFFCNSVFIISCMHSHSFDLFNSTHSFFLYVSIISISISYISYHTIAHYIYQTCYLYLWLYA